MDPSGAGGNAAAKHARTKPQSDNSGSVTDVDSFDLLPDDLLFKILSSVDSSPDAVRTSVLSRRWSPLWKCLPELRFPFFPEPANLFGAALGNHQVPLRHLQVQGHGQGALPRAIATWLPAAARRVSGSFVLRNTKPPTMDDERGEGEEEEEEDEEEDEEEAAAIELPCFPNATSISICLGFLGSFSMPPPPVPPPADAAAGGGGVFSHLTDLCLERIWFQQPSELGDAVSSARCPCLKNLKLCNTAGLDVVNINSTSLLKMKLEEVNDLQDLIVEAPELKELAVVDCFVNSPMPFGPIVVTIDAPELLSLDWRDDLESQSHVQDQLSKFPRLRSLGTFMFFVYGNDHFGAHNRRFLEVLQGTRFLEDLSLTLTYAEDLEDNQYLMEDVTMLPKVRTLHLTVVSMGHSFGASLFHILRVCIGIRKLVLELHATPEEPLTCPPECNCGHQSNWRSEMLLLARLEEIEIQRFGRTTRDLHFVEQLFAWTATALKKATIIFDIIVREDVAKDLCRMVEFFSRSEVHIEFRYHDNKEVLYAPED